MTAGLAGQLAVSAILLIGGGALISSLIGRRFEQMDRKRLAQMSPTTKKILGL